MTVVLVLLCIAASGRQNLLRMIQIERQKLGSSAQLGSRVSKGYDKGEEGGSVRSLARRKVLIRAEEHVAAANGLCVY